MKGKKTAPAAPAAPQEMDPRFTEVVEAFGGDPDVDTRRMFGATGLNIRGKAFAMLSSKGNLVVKLPRERVDALVASGAGVHFDPGHGRPMKEWLDVRDAGIDWITISREARTFVEETNR